MRCSLLTVVFALYGCGKGSAPVPSVPLPPSVDAVAGMREADAEAAYSLDAASEAIADALTATRKLAPAVGGDAKDALLDVAEMLDSAGATLADHDEPPPDLETYRKAQAEGTEERRKALDAALDALHELRDAQGTLDDLSETAPPPHRDALAEIGGGVEEAIGAVEGAVVKLGGRVPPEEE